MGESIKRDAELRADELDILEKLEDVDDLLEHCHHALVHNPFAWTA